MIVCKIGDPGDHYQYMVDLKKTLRQVDKKKIRDWAKTINLKCFLMTSSIYLRTEEDVSVFLLRWA
jgi:hypothetical protein